MQFMLLQSGQVRGNQLADEIQAATGLDVRFRYSLTAPGVVEITGEDVEAQAEAVHAVIAAHVPQKTSDEIAQESADGNRTTLHTRLKQAYASCLTYEGLAAPTNAQTAAHVKLLSRIARGMIRLQLGELDELD